MIPSYCNKLLFTKGKHVFTAEIAKQLSASSVKAVITQATVYPIVLSAMQTMSNTTQIPMILVKDKVCMSIILRNMRLVASTCFSKMTVFIRVP